MGGTLEEPVPHGGDLGEARRLFPGAPEPWIDLSTGINPVAYPVPALPPEAFTRLPSPDEVTALETVAADAYGVTPAEVVAAPGTQALISLLPRLVARPDLAVAVVGPTYAEHARAWRRARHPVAEVASTAEAEGACIAVVVDPNNPDGRRTPPATAARLASGCADRGGLLVVDEAFADLETPAGLGGARPPGAVVLRSFGKTYGLAGLRLGFLLAEPALAARARTELGPWAVSGPAIAIGRLALADAAWREAAAAARLADAERLDALLAEAGGRVIGGTRLFRTAELVEARTLFARLGRAGIWTRRFASKGSWLRFGLPGSEPAWARLSRVLRPDP
jgi:cobalamin biosynthesis protein CobC